MKKKIGVLALGVFGLLVVSQASATTRYLGPAASGVTYTTLTAALAACATGDTIVLLQNTNENAVFPGGWGTKKVTIQSDATGSVTLTAAGRTRTLNYTGNGTNPTLDFGNVNTNGYSVTLMNLVINNQTTAASGGVPVNLNATNPNTTASVVFLNCEFRRDTATAGNGILVNQTGGQPGAANAFQFIRCDFSGNAATGNTLAGLYLGSNGNQPNGHPAWYVENSVFHDMTAANSAGISWGYSTANTGPDASFNNDTFFNCGWGISSKGPVNVTNCLFAANSVGDFTFNATGNAMKNSLFANDTFYNRPTQTLTPVFTACITTTPTLYPTEFVNGTLGAENLNLASGARSVDAGKAIASVPASGIFAAGAIDHDSTARPQGSAWDIGAYEFTPPTPTPSNTPTSTATSTLTNTPTPLVTSTPTDSPTPTPSSTPTNTPTVTSTSTGCTDGSGNTCTFTATPTDSPTGTASSTATDSPSSTATSTPTATATLTASLTATNSPTPTPSSTPSATPTDSGTATATPVPHKLNLMVAQNGANNPCSGQTYQPLVRVYNWDSVPVTLGSLTVKFWLNAPSGKTIVTNGCYGGAVYSPTGIYVSGMGCSTSVAAVTPFSINGRTANTVCNLTFSSSGAGVTLQPNGGYVSLDSSLQLALNDFSSPFDPGCSDYSNLGIGTYHDDPYFAVYENGALVCEYLNATTVDPASGVPPGATSACGFPIMTNTPTSTPTNTATSTATNTPSGTPTLTASSTPSATPTPTDSATDSPTATPTFSATDTATLTATETATLTPTDTPTDTATDTPTQTATDTTTLTATDTPTGTSTETATLTATTTATDTPTMTPTGTATLTATSTPSGTSSDTPVDTLTPTRTATGTATDTATTTATPSATSTATNTSTDSMTPTPTLTPTGTVTSTASPTASTTPTSTPTDSMTPTASLTASATPSPTASLSPSSTPSQTPTGTASFTPTSTPTPSETSTSSPAPAVTASFTPSNTPAVAIAAATPLIFPNPAEGPGPVTVLLGLANNGEWVEMKLYTTAYRKVKGLRMENLPAGTSRLALDLNDDWGKPLANGIYFLVVDSPESKSTLKLLILR